VLWRPVAKAGREVLLSCPGGVEVVAHSLRDVLRKHAESDLALLKIDFSNAFNCVDREAFMRTTCEEFPGLANWTNWCYGEESFLLYDHSERIVSSAGVQQGDPLGPLYFCFGLTPLVAEIAKLQPVYQKWYMDDGGIVAPVPVLLKVWQLLREKGPPLGLHLNPKKCEWSWLNASCPAGVPLPLKEEGVALVPTHEVCMLGVPLGSAPFSAAFVEERLFSRVKTAMERLVALDDSQSALYLLRVSYGIVRATHFMRTTPLAAWECHASRFDRDVRRAAEEILGTPFDDRAYAQAALTPSLGGLGLRRVVDHADGAFAASWRESMSTARESWEQPPQCLTHLGSQTQNSLAVDQAILARLVSQSSSEREKKRLARLQEEHAGAWVTAVPARVDGSDCSMSPQVFRTAVRYRLGLRVARDDVQCSFCMQPFDCYGDHAACCKRKADVICAPQQDSQPRVPDRRRRAAVSRVGEEGHPRRSARASARGRDPAVLEGLQGFGCGRGRHQSLQHQELARSRACGCLRSAQARKVRRGVRSIELSVLRHGSGDHRGLQRRGVGVPEAALSLRCPAAKHQVVGVCRAGLGQVVLQPSGLGGSGYPQSGSRGRAES
jgi:hypothetical protein